MLRNTGFGRISNLVGLDRGDLLVLLDMISRLFGEGAESSFRDGFCHVGYFDDGFGILESRGTKKRRLRE
jgi:hypothetical protein